MVVAAGDAKPPWDSPITPPDRISLASASSASCRRRALSSCFREPASPRRIAWVSLQGRLVGAEEVASAAAVAPGIGSQEAVAWELFSPLHRVLVVATVAAATSRSRAACRIEQLQRSIDLRDEVLQSMQQKLDDLCDQMNSMQEQYVNCDGFIFSEQEKLGLVYDKKQGDEEGARSCVYARRQTGTAPYKTKNFGATDDDRSDVVDKVTISLVEQEERRMSDLSDFSWGVVSSADHQLSSLAAEQEFYNLQKECDEKDATIKKLAAEAQASSAADSNRIAELLEVLRRKNMVISKLKKDMAALKQMVVELTRAKRASSITSTPNCSELPVMSNNVLYDMSSTSPSSSDNESPVTLREYLGEHFVTDTQEGTEPKERCGLLAKKTSHLSIKSSTCKQRSTSRLRENRINPTAETNSIGRQKHLISSNGDFKRVRRRSQQDPKNKTTRRWL